MSGYGDTVKVINLKAELKTNKKILSNIMDLNDEDFDKFFDNIGFNFQMIFEWVDLKEKINLDAFIADKIVKRKAYIAKVFEEEADLLGQIMKAKKIDNLKFKMKELEFLQKNNIIISCADDKIGWYDRDVEKAFEDLRKE